jgi:diacylglycerol kinase (ATP)
MKTGKSFSLKARLQSFRYAFSGLGRFFFEEHNAILHMLATVTVVILIFFFRIRGAEMLSLVIVTGGVWITELINTAIENIMDMISPEKHPKVKYIKDLAAAAVLIASIVALITGSIVLLPKIIYG